MALSRCRPMTSLNSACGIAFKMRSSLAMTVRDAGNTNHERSENRFTTRRNSTEKIQIAVFPVSVRTHQEPGLCGFHDIINAADLACNHYAPK